MTATVPHVTSGLGLRKFQADGFLLTRVYIRVHKSREPNRRATKFCTVTPICSVFPLTCETVYRFIFTELKRQITVTNLM